MPIEALTRLIPSLAQLALCLPLGVVWVALAMSLAGTLKIRRCWPTGYTRKLVHFAIFSASAVISLYSGTGGVCAFGLGGAAIIGFALLRGDGNVLYESIARERDLPHRSYYIMVPFSATVAGGLISDLCFGPRAAALGYLIAGLADAAAEPVGTRWGRHRYRIPSRIKTGATRSVEGSLAVLVISFAVLCGYAFTLDGIAPAFAGPTLLTLVLLFALAVGFTVVEALAPHGGDNLLLQVLPAATAAWWLLAR